MTNEEAVAILKEKKHSVLVFYYDKPLAEAVAVAIEALQERKTGKWIGEYKEVTIDEYGNTTGSCNCSVCGDWLTGSDEYPTRGRYCPNCGAKMDVDV